MKRMNTTGRTRLTAEQLEAREVPATLSVADATFTEIGSPSAFVTTGSGGLDSPKDLVLGPDGDLYVASSLTNSVIRYSGTTGQLIGTFVAAGSGGLDLPFGLAFGPDGNLYVGSERTDAIYRYSGTTGTFLDTFVPTGAGGLDVPKGIVFGRDGNLYVGSRDTDSILRYQGPAGAVPGNPLPAAGQSGATFVASGSGGLIDPHNLLLGPDGHLYVASDLAGAGVLKFDGTTGTFIATVVSAGAGGLVYPRGMGFDQDGRLYVADLGGNAVHRYDSQGQYLDDPIIASGSPLRNSVGLIFDAQGALLVSSPGADIVVRYGGVVVSLSEPSATPVSVGYVTVGGTATSDIDFTNQSGTVTFAPGQTSRQILLATRDDGAAEPTETFTVELSNPTGGATIADGVGVVSITDNDTKFFVVNDGSPDRTYEYGPTGTAGDNYALGSGNTAPRGAASTAAGDKVWVVDANRKVYVYDAAGTLLGSWTANGLSSPQGITVWGNDVWIVDSSADKVFKYAGAATRLSGSQNAASSFALNSGNKDPRDLVTDGTSIWVVNNSTTDKVFKYTLAGSHQGNWTLSGGGGSPTGITLDPSAPAHLWVVDNGTDRVYQYDNAVGRTSGSQAASTSFALAAGNTNPQGIADPPVPGGVPLDPPARADRTADRAARRVAAAAPVAGYWLPPEAYDFAPIDVNLTRGKGKRA